MRRAIGRASLSAGVRWAAAATILIGLALAPMSIADATPAIRIRADINGRRLATTSSSHPFRLVPDRAVQLRLAVTNRGTRPLVVSTVRFRGRVIGLTFYDYDTAVGIEVKPGQTETRRFQLDLSGLRDQATGLIPSSLDLLDAHRHRVASERGVVDVRGSWHSVYGVFGLSVAAVTLLLLAGSLLAVARHRLPQNRLRRGLSFLGPGIGIGLSIVFTFSALGLMTPGTGAWVPAIAISAVVLFALGCASPTPEAGGDEFEGPLPQPELATPAEQPRAIAVFDDEIEREATASAEESEEPTVAHPSGPLPKVTNEREPLTPVSSSPALGAGTAPLDRR